MQEKLDKSQELIDLKEQLSSAQEFISVLQKENEELRVEVRVKPLIFPKVCKQYLFCRRDSMKQLNLIRIL